MLSVRVAGFVAAFAALAMAAWANGAEVDQSLIQRHWFEARTLHFHTYSCGPTQAVARLAARLEQFHDAYAALAGARAVDSPPIAVLAFPDRESLQEFLPLYGGHPANLAGFFHRSSDENLIVLSLAENGPGSLETILHEYAHLLLRRNEAFWPAWLNEGMADIYATFEVAGEHTVRVGQAIPVYLELLSRQTWMPLSELFEVTQTSPGYNERQRQGVFYAESWLLCQYLMHGGTPERRARFAELTRLLRAGQLPQEAFTNAFRLSLRAMEQELKQYFAQKRIEPQLLTVRGNLLAAQPLGTRALTPVEVLFRLGDELLRIGRMGGAEAYFQQARERAPASPLPYEGLGLLAAERGQHEIARDFLREALQRRSASFLAYYVLAREQFRAGSREPGKLTRLDPPLAAEVRTELEKSLALMPEFGPAHQLLGILELTQGEDPRAAEQELELAVQLEPENQGYLLTLAQAQLLRKDVAGARRTLEPLTHRNAAPELRVHARQLLQETERQQ